MNPYATAGNSYQRNSKRLLHKPLSSSYENGLQNEQYPPLNENALNDTSTTQNHYYDKDNNNNNHQEDSKKKVKVNEGYNDNLK